LTRLNYLVSTRVLGKLQTSDIFNCCGCKLVKFTTLPFIKSISKSHTPFWLDLLWCIGSIFGSYQRRIPLLCLFPLMIIVFIVRFILETLFWVFFFMYILCILLNRMKLLKKTLLHFWIYSFLYYMIQFPMKFWMRLFLFLSMLLIEFHLLLSQVCLPFKICMVVFLISHPWNVLVFCFFFFLIHK